ncbi:MAG TPA: class I SAM-dependent methyltransferase [Dehalococcoidia bacterium]|nr:class I SAM-dependent methyltransferase [Dehalococcoidia bacterium]
MPRGWQWDPTLFAGSARYYRRGRLPYPPGLAATLAEALGLDGRGRLLDVGCGPGIVALQLSHLFAEVVGLDPDAEMLTEAARVADEQGIGNARWVQARAEELPAGLGGFRVATFAASFHWMDRDRVAAAVRQMLEPGGAFVQISADQQGRADPDPLPYLAPPRAEMEALVRRYLGPERRAGQGVLRYGTPGDELAVLRRAGFPEPQIVAVPGGEIVIRTIDDLVAAQFSNSGSAPHLFGERRAEFESELRHLLEAASPSGLFAQQTDDCELRIWRRPQ